MSIELANSNMMDEVLKGFLTYELKYYSSIGFNMLHDKPKYTPELSFDDAFIDDEQIFKDNFDTIYDEQKHKGSKQLKSWVAMTWNRDYIVPSFTRRNQRKLVYKYYDVETKSTRQALLRLVETNLYVCMFCNTRSISSLVEQRNLVDRGHSVPITIDINNKYITNDLLITAEYPYQHILTVLNKEQYGGIVSLQYGVKLVLPIISPYSDKSFDFNSLRIKVVVG